MTNSDRAVHLWLRDETKPFEKRTALTPQDARKLVEAGFRVTVESSEGRVFPDSDYSRAGCAVSAAGSWRRAPADALILGLKELPEEQTPLAHRHIYFAHAYKKQAGWQALLTRFAQGNGMLLDLEYLTDDQGRRVAAFGRWAGFAGAALGVDLWSHQQLSGAAPYSALSAYPDRKQLVDQIRSRLESAMDKAKVKPRTLIIGSKGRCGSGARDLLQQVGLLDAATGWDMEETSKGGPFEEILDFEILVNCVLVQGNMAPFLTDGMLDRARKLKVISDVSCDPHSPFNPIPVYKNTTTFQRPELRLREGLLLTAIDHLPSLLPRESSEDFSAQLLPHLLELREGSNVWRRAAELFVTKAKELSQ